VISTNPSVNCDSVVLDAFWLLLNETEINFIINSNIVIVEKFRYVNCRIALPDLMHMHSILGHLHQKQIAEEWPTTSAKIDGPANN
jgi:hypothetical protein